MKPLAWRSVDPQYLLCSLLSYARHVHSTVNAWGIGCVSSKCNTRNSLWDVSDFRELSICWCFLLSDVTPRIFIRSLYVFRPGHPYSFFGFRTPHNGPRCINYNDSVEILRSSLFWLALYLPRLSFFVCRIVLVVIYRILVIFGTGDCYTICLEERHGPAQLWIK